MSKEEVVVQAEKEEQNVITPFYYVKKRLFANKPAVFGMGVILFAIVLSILGYSIMPDNTPNADDRAEQISKLPPMSKVTVVKVRKDLEVERRNFFMATLFGQPSPYKTFPIEAKDAYRIEGLDLYLKIYGSGGAERRLSLVETVEPLFVGDTKLLETTTNGHNYEYNQSTDIIKYVSLKGELKEISRDKLIKEFEQNSIETRTYLLGTDIQGRDTLSRLLFGVRISLGIGLISVVISFLVGTSLGALAGFFGGRVDSFILWFMTVVWSIPGIMLVIAISLALGRGVLVAFIAIGLTTWVEIARVVRGQIMSIKEKQYVEAARAMGMRSVRIIAVHIMPNIIGPLIVILTSNFASAILTEAGLSFLGLSVQPPMASWGIMVYEGSEVVTTKGGIYLVAFPSLCIALMVLAFNLFGNGLRDAYDPKTNID